MKTAAVIAEYNPFHMGHFRQLHEIKKFADVCIVIMSGNYVQRGAPAIVDKFTRAKWALLHGADLVFELPTVFATAGAEQFAFGACSLLDRLGFVDMLCFGSETCDITWLDKAAGILAAPPKSFHEHLQALLRQGMSYASAREEALYPLFTGKAAENSLCREAFHTLISAPNTILGVEYCKSLKLLNSPITPVPMPRKGSAYHDSFLPDSTDRQTEDTSENAAKSPSASAVRQHLFQHPAHPEQLAGFVPDDVLSDLTALPLMHEDDFSSCLYYALLGKTPKELAQYYEVSDDLAQRIVKCLPEFTDISSFVSVLKTKQLAHARIRRSLLHILLSIEKEDIQQHNVLRLLGLRKESSHLLRQIPEQTGPFLITKAADAFKKLPEHEYRCFQKETNASQLYGFTAQKKSGTSTVYRELAVPPVIL